MSVLIRQSALLVIELLLDEMGRSQLLSLHIAPDLNRQVESGDLRRWYFNSAGGSDRVMFLTLECVSPVDDAMIIRWTERAATWLKGTGVRTGLIECAAGKLFDPLFETSDGSGHIAAMTFHSISTQVAIRTLENCQRLISEGEDFSLIELASVHRWILERSLMPAGIDREREIESWLRWMSHIQKIKPAQQWCEVVAEAELMVVSQSPELVALSVEWSRGAGFGKLDEVWAEFEVPLRQVAGILHEKVAPRLPAEKTVSFLIQHAFIHQHLQRIEVPFLVENVITRLSLRA